jgi:hypothetical protein
VILRLIVALLAVSACACASGRASEVQVTSSSSSTTSTARVPASTTTTLASTTTSAQPTLVVPVTIRVESHVDDVSDSELEAVVRDTLADPRGWARAGFDFEIDESSDLVVVLAEPAETDALCKPLVTKGSVSCQNGKTVAINATRWRTATDDWDRTVDDYRQYVINHEVGHLIGQRHPEPRCPEPGKRAAVMEQQTKGLRGCVGNVWPLPWEVVLAEARPATIAPLPDWSPGPAPRNLGG